MVIVTQAFVGLYWITGRDLKGGMFRTCPGAPFRVRPLRFYQYLWTLGCPRAKPLHVHMFIQFKTGINRYSQNRACLYGVLAEKRDIGGCFGTWSQKFRTHCLWKNEYFAFLRSKKYWKTSSSDALGLPRPPSPPRQASQAQPAVPDAVSE